MRTFLGWRTAALLGSVVITLPVHGQQAVSREQAALSLLPPRVGDVDTSAATTELRRNGDDGHPTGGSAAQTDSLAGVITLRIGALDGPPVYLFGDVSGIVEDAGGRIFVADAQADEVRVFNPEGVFLFSIGRHGGGPGELKRPCCLAFSPDSILWVRDGGNARYVGFRVSSDSAQSLSTVRMAQPDVWFHAPLAFAPGGEFIDTGSQPSQSGSENIVRYYLRDSGRSVRSEVIDRPSPAELGTVVKHSGADVLFFQQPFGPQSLVAFGPGAAWATAVSSEFKVEGHDGAGATWFAALRPTEGPGLSPEEQAQANARIDAYVRVGGGARSDYPTIPQRKPPLAALVFDQTGRLWVLFNTAADEPARAAVYDETGNLVGVRSWPHEVSLAFPSWIGGQDALGVAADSLGVQQVVRLRFK